jgi:hypothetical protein
MRKPSGGRFRLADATVSSPPPSLEVVSTVERLNATSAKASAVNALGVPAARDEAAEASGSSVRGPTAPVAGAAFPASRATVPASP